MLVDPDRDVAQDVFVEPFLPLDLVEDGGRRIDVEQHVVRLAVLAQPVGERLDAPLLGLGDLAAHLLDDADELGGQFLDLLRADVLARKEDVFVERHEMPFPFAFPVMSWSKPRGFGIMAVLSRRVALRALSGKARMLRRREHRTPDRSVLPPAKAGSRPFSSRPGTSGSGVYRQFQSKRKAQSRGNAASVRVPASTRPG